MYIKVEGETLVRDTRSNAILETDKEKLMKHRAMQAKIQDKEQKIDYLIDRINKLEQLIERMTNGNNTI
jgi:cell division protein FtsB